MPLVNTAQTLGPAASTRCSPSMFAPSRSASPFRVFQGEEERPLPDPSAPACVPGGCCLSRSRSPNPRTTSAPAADPPPPRQLSLVRRPNPPWPFSPSLDFFRLALRRLSAAVSPSLVSDRAVRQQRGPLAPPAGWGRGRWHRRARPCSQTSRGRAPGTPRACAFHHRGGLGVGDPGALQPSGPSLRACPPAPGRGRTPALAPPASPTLPRVCQCLALLSLLLLVLIFPDTCDCGSVSIFFFFLLFLAFSSFYFPPFVLFLQYRHLRTCLPLLVGNLIYLYFWLLFFFFTVLFSSGVCSARRRPQLPPLQRGLK